MFQVKYKIGDVFDGKEIIEIDSRKIKFPTTQSLYVRCKNCNYERWYSIRRFEQINSCSCKRHGFKVGDIVNNYKILGYDYSGKFMRYTAKCRCGNITIKSAGQLYNNDTCVRCRYIPNVKIDNKPAFLPLKYIPKPKKKITERIVRIKDPIKWHKVS